MSLQIEGHNRKVDMKMKFSVNRTVRFWVLFIGGLIMVLPLVWAISTSLKTTQDTFIVPPQFIPHPFVWSNYAKVWHEEPFGLGFINTMIIEVTVLTIGTFFSTLAAFAFAKMNFPFKETIFIGLLSTMMIPYSVIMIPQFIAFSHIHWVNTLLPLIVPGLFGHIMMIFFIRQFMKGAIPNDLIEAAKIDGCGYLRTFLTVAVPLVKPAIVAQIALGFVGIWNDFLGPLIYLQSTNRQTLQVMVSSLQALHISSSNFPVIMCASLISMAPIIIIFIFAQRYFIESLGVTGLKG